MKAILKAVFIVFLTSCIICQCYALPAETATQPPAPTTTQVNGLALTGGILNSIGGIFTQFGGGGR